MSRHDSGEVISYEVFKKIGLVDRQVLPLRSHSEMLLRLRGKGNQGVLLLQ